MINDLTKRLPNVLNDGKLPCDKQNIHNLILWLNDKALPLDNNTVVSGASAIYVFS